MVFLNDYEVTQWRLHNTLWGKIRDEDRYLDTRMMREDRHSFARMIRTANAR